MEFIARVMKHPNAGSADPFHTGDSMNRDRLIAAAFQLEKGDFPAALEYCRTDVNSNLNDPFATELPGWDWSLLKCVAARWTDLDPQAAFDWVEKSELEQDGVSPENLKILMARELLRSDPDLSLEFIERFLKKGNSAEVLARPEDFTVIDPFVERDEMHEFNSVEGSQYFTLLCREHPARALELYALASPALQYDGMEGWAVGMVGAGRFAEAIEFAGALGEKRSEALRDHLLEALGSSDPARLAEWLNRQEGATDKGLDRDVMVFMAKEDRQEAAEWYLNRSKDREDREMRLSDVAMQFESMDESAAWLWKMEGLGENTGRAWENVVRRAGLREAMELLPNVAAGRRDEVLKELLKRGTNEVWVRVGNDSGYLYEAKQEEKALIEAGGFAAEFEAFVCENNANVTTMLLDSLTKRGLVETEERK